MHADFDASGVAGLSYAFQPIVDIASRLPYAYEALLRGARNEPAGVILGALDETSIETIDKLARPRAIALAARLGMRTRLHLNFQPRSLAASNAVIDQTLAVAHRHGFDNERVVLEVTETQVIDDQRRFADAINEFRAEGVMVAIDDFGAGYSGLNLLANFQPDLVKLDMELVRGIAHHGPRQAIVRAIRQACNDLGIDVIAEGVETLEEFHWFEDEGLTLFQGYLFARPGFECLPSPCYPGARPMIRVL
jgi:EAL domain-containing protein (putative c-di-GMP-specific phosphodiesterase class I)